MPVIVDSQHSPRNGSANAASLPSGSLSQSLERTDGYITIGLLNNMPQPAFAATERQFISVLNRASEDLLIRLSLYYLPDAVALDQCSESVANRYSGIDELCETELDGLIVTGKEPTTSNLRDEACWDKFVRVIEWARMHTKSTVWSCLAAHAAVLHLDGIDRRKNIGKYFGVFQCGQIAPHALLAGGPSAFQVPHSRWNSVHEDELLSHGYSVITRIPGLGVDTFVKEEGSLFVFFQGHPEYDSDTLLREYRRDVGRYLNREVEAHPSIPVGYFDLDTEQTLTALREYATSHRDAEVLARVCSALDDARPTAPWRGTAACIYKNWLEDISLRTGKRQLGNAIVA